MTTVLVIEDEASMARALRINLSARDYTVLTAGDGKRGLSAASAERPDVVILDLGLPDMDGTEVIAGLRGWSDVPIIVLSAREREPDKVAALDAGADDYVTKPFGMEELLARLRAATRRPREGGATETAAVAIEAFVVDFAARRVSDPDGRVVRLTPTEWSIVEALVRNAGRLVTGHQLLRQVWGEQYESEGQYLRQYLNQIRRKLEPDPSRPRYFRTEPGMGYRFEPGPSAPADLIPVADESRPRSRALDAVSDHSTG